VAQLIRERASKYGDRTAFRYKRGAAWEGISWRQVGERVQAVAQGLVELSLPELSSVGICAPNRPEWSLADLGTSTARCVSVPIYPTSSPKQLAYILNEAEVKVLFAGGRGGYDKALSVASECPHLQNIVLFDESVETRGGLSCSFSDFLNFGRNSSAAAEVEERLSRAGPDDLLTIVYTSGTTGEPKGVMLTHANLFAALRAHDGRLLDPNDGDLTLCFLPLSHVFERCWTYYALYKGMTNHYLEDPTEVVQAMQDVRPTIMCAVPRFFEKVHAGILAGLEEMSSAKRAVFWWGHGVGRKALEYRRRDARLPLGLGLKHAIADALVLKKIRALLGGRVKFLPCAGAPLPRGIEEFFQASGLFITHGYGLTETTATVTCHETTGYEPGTVGKPLPGVEVKIAQGGEILVRGGNVMKGYFKKPEATAEACEDGWFKTGDAGSLDGEGRLTITDRLKDLMKTSSGKYVAPQQIEVLLEGDPFFGQVCVVGDGRRFVSALVVPDFPVLEAFAKARGIASSSRAELCKNHEVLALFRERIDARTKNLARHEQVKKFVLLSEPFSIEGGDLTPTLKVRRRGICEKYARLIESLYAQD